MLIQTNPDDSMMTKKRKSHTWEPVPADKVPEPENCPNAVSEFYNRSKSGTVRSVRMKSNVRKHLLFLNWSIEYKSQENCSDKYRYISPDCSKTYYSLKTLCTDLIESAEPGWYSSQQPPLQVETSPLIPQEDQTLKIRFIETLPFTSLLTNYDYMSLPIETPSPTPNVGPNYNSSFAEEPVVQEYLANGQTCNLSEYAPIEQPVTHMELTEGENCNVPSSLSFSTPVVEPDVCQYLETSTMDIHNFNPQEEPVVENLSPVTQYDDLATVSSGPLTQGQNCNLPTSPLFSSPIVEPQVMCQLNSNPQEESLIETPSPVTQYDKSAVVPSGSLIKKSKSRNPVSARDFADIEPELYPGAILEYFNVGSEAARDQKDDGKLKDLRMKVKKHMCAVGWDIFYINIRNRRELRYASPITGKTFMSLITACKAYLGEQENYNQIPLLTNSQKKSQKRRAPHQDSSYLPLNPFGRPPLPSLVASTVKMGPSSSRVHRRNLLVKLIEGNRVNVGMEVYYRGRDNKPMAEGHICADAMIMCTCCQKTMNLSNFEVHAGSNNHRPAAYTFLKDGRSLQDCHLLLNPEEKQTQLILKSKPEEKQTQLILKPQPEENQTQLTSKPQPEEKQTQLISERQPEEKQAQLILKRRNGNVNSENKLKKAKGNHDHRWKRYKCSICNKLDALVLCYQCPSKFHTSCLGLSDVPNGEWFCKTCEDEPVNKPEFCPGAVVAYFLDGNILTMANDRNKRLTNLRSKAKMDLLWRGWKFIQVDGENKRELKYRSPSGKDYPSLSAACAAIIFGEGNSSIV